MKKVLIIDDDDNLRTIIKDVMKAEGFMTLEATDGPDGIKTFKADRPDVVLFDLKIPEELKGEVVDGAIVLYWEILTDRVLKQVTQKQVQ